MRSVPAEKMVRYNLRRRRLNDGTTEHTSTVSCKGIPCEKMPYDSYLNPVVELPPEQHN